MEHSLMLLVYGLTESQARIAEGLGWSDDLAFSPKCYLVKHIDKILKKFGADEAVHLQIPEPAAYVRLGSPFYALTNESVLSITREFVRGEPVYSSNYPGLQADEDYKATLLKLMQLLVPGREIAAFCKVTKISSASHVNTRSIMASASAECDIFVPTGLCKGLSSRNGQHITDAQVFATVVSDYIKIMRKIQKRGFELNAHFYLTRPSDIQLIKESPQTAKKIWGSGNIRNYRKVTITEEGEVILQLFPDRMMADGKNQN